MNLSDVSSPRMGSRSLRHDADDHLEWLIDNAAAYDRLLFGLAGAQRSVSIVQLALDADCVAYGETAAPTSFADTLLHAAARSVDVRILLNATLLLDTAAPLRRFIAAAGASDRVGVRRVSRFPSLLHAKFAIVD